MSYADPNLAVTEIWQAWNRFKQEWYTRHACFICRESGLPEFEQCCHREKAALPVSEFWKQQGEKS